MKKLLPFLLLFSIFIASGCINNLIPNTPTQNSSITPATLSTPTEDPIIGIWHWTLYDHSKTIFYTFTLDGHYSTSDSMNEGTESGTWIKYGDNQYNVTVDGRKKLLFEYLPQSDTVVMLDAPDLHFYRPGVGSPIVTPNPNLPTPSDEESSAPLLSSQLPPQHNSPSSGQPAPAVQKIQPVTVQTQKVIQPQPLYTIHDVVVPTIAHATQPPGGL
jgi:hypothetical protein